MILDLSVPINTHTPVYPGDPSTSIKQVGDFDEHGYIDHLVSMGTHIGTHIDAPLHMIEGGKSLDKMPIEQFVGKAHCIDARDGNFLAMRNKVIEGGDIVIFYTGMSHVYHDSAYFTDYPALSLEDADYLVDRGVKMVGLDTCSADNEDGFPIHKKLLSHDILIIENLTNLEQLIGKTFNLYALPLNLELDGAPARIIAELL